MHKIKIGGVFHFLNTRQVNVALMTFHNVEWAKQGVVLTTEGNVIHYGFIEEFIEELGTKYDTREVAFDCWGAVQISQNLEGLGVTVVPFG